MGRRAPLAQGLLTGRVRKGRQPDLRRSGQYFSHLAMAFAIAHPGVTAALLGPRTVEQLDMAYNPPAVTNPALRRRPVNERTAA